MKALLTIIGLLLVNFSVYADCTALYSNPKPFEILIEDPVGRLKQWAKFIAFETKPLQRDESNRFTRIEPASSQLPRDKERYSEQISAVRELLTYIERNYPTLKPEVSKRKKIFKEFNTHIQTATSSLELYAKLQDFYNNLDTPELIQIIRQQNISLEQDTHLQKLLQEVTFGILKTLVSNVVRHTGHPLGWEVNFPKDLGKFVGDHVMLNNHFQKGDTVQIYASGLLLEVLKEIHKNALEAAFMRAPYKNREELFPLARVIRELDGVRIEVEDFGDPQKYYQVTGFGQTGYSNPQANKRTSGIGLGRFWTEVLAQFMGYTITHEAKTDGSGSIVSVHIPKSHIVPRTEYLTIPMDEIERSLDNYRMSKYIKPHERYKYKVYVKEGLLYDYQGNLINKIAMFAMDKFGDIYLLDRGHGYHSSILGDDPVAAVGHLDIQKGVIVLADDNSGHYRPPSGLISQLKHSLDKKNVDTSKIKFVNYAGRPLDITLTPEQIQKIKERNNPRPVRIIGVM